MVRDLEKIEGIDYSQNVVIDLFLDRTVTIVLKIRHPLDQVQILL